MKDAELQQKIVNARTRADLARMRFGNALNATVHRLDPERLAADALVAASDQFDLVKGKLFQRIRYWPLVAGPVVLVLSLLMFWRPARTVARYAARAGTLAWTYRNLWRPKA